MIALITKALACGFQPIGNPDYPTLRKQAAVAVQLGFRFNPVTLWPEVCFDITENPTDGRTEEVRNGGRAPGSPTEYLEQVQA